MGTDSKPSKRDSRLDIARGVAIAAIVLVHVFRGLDGAGILTYEDTAVLDRIVGPWCLSVFAFVGGTFVPRGAQKRGIGGYIWDRSVQFLFIYVLWTVLQGAVQLAAASAVNSPTSVSTLLKIWAPTAQLWYLPFLVLVTVVFVPMKPWITSRAPWILGIAAVISIAFWGYDGGYIGTQGLGLVFFFVAGMVVGSQRVRAALDRFSPAVAAVVSVSVLVGGAAISVAASATGVTVMWSSRTVTTVAVGIVVALATSAAVLLFGHAVRSWSWLAFLGQRSLDVYLAHITVASSTRVILLKLGVTTPWLLIVICFLAGVLGSLVVATLLRRIGLKWLFDGPEWLAKKPPTTRRKSDSPVT